MLDLWYSNIALYYFSVNWDAISVDKGGMDDFYN